jgi:hypothetical protein
VTVFAFAVCLQVTASELNPRWRWSNPQPHGGNLRALSYHEGRLLHLAERGQIYASDALYRWVPVHSGTVRDLRAATRFNETLIITAEEGTVLVFDSLQLTETVNLHTSDWLEGVAASPTEVVAAGDNGAVYRSTDGVHWQRQSVSFTDWLTAIAYSPSVPIFVVVGHGGFVATSPDGRTWSPQTSGTNANLNRVAWIEDRFVAVGDAGTVLTSATGTNWTELDTGATNTLYAVAGDAHSLLVAGQSELRMATRENGEWVWANQINGANTGVPSWTYLSAVREPTSTTNTSYWVGGRTGLLIYGQRQGSHWAWAREDASLRNWLWDVARTPEFYVAVGDKANILTSVDGASGDLELVPTSVTNNILLGTGGTTNLLLAVGNKGTIVHSTNQWIDLVVTGDDGSVTTNRVSTLGLMWEAVEPRPTTNDLQAVTATATGYFVGGGRGTILGSPDATNWTQHDSGTTNFLSSMVAFPGGLVAVGENGTLLLGTKEGTGWTARDAQTTRWLYRVRHLNGELVIVGEAGTVLRSPDGERWTKVDTGNSQWLYDIVWMAGRYYAAGAQGTVIVSPNLVDWSDVGASTRKSIFSLSSHDGQLLAAGVEGLILRAPIAPQLTAPQILTYLQTTNSNVFLIAGEMDQQMILQRSSSLEDSTWTTSAELEVWSADGTLIYYEPLASSPPPYEFFRLRVTQAD